MSKFLLGSSTASHQVEGNNIHSDYWAMEHMETTSFNEPSLDAVDHYHHYEEDIRLMAKAGLNAYRFSIEWARIEPKQGVYDEKEVEHYKDMIACCKKNGIEPIVTLHHFTSPKWTIEQGGWEEEKIADFFASYVSYVTEKILKGNVHYVCTINEANMGIQVAEIAKRYKAQMMAQMGKRNVEGQAQVGMNFNAMMEKMAKNREENLKVFGTDNPQVFVSSRTPNGDLIVMKAHEKARKAIKEVDPSIQVGLTLSLHDIQVLGGGDVEAKKAWEDEFTHYLPFLKEDDFLGLQNYSRAIYGPRGLIPSDPSKDKVTQMGYENYPEALGHVIQRVHKELGLPIIVTENGIATENDEERVVFIQKALKGLEEAREAGANVLGYFHWSFLDNFEWQKGFSMRFGLVSVDRKTMVRTPKESLFVLGSFAKKL